MFGENVFSKLPLEGGFTYSLKNCDIFCRDWYVEPNGECPAILFTLFHLHL